MTDHISTPLFFLHWAMLCTAISEICPPALKWGGGLIYLYLVNASSLYIEEQPQI